MKIVFAILKYLGLTLIVLVTVVTLYVAFDTSPKVAQSSETFSTLADIHDDEQAIAQTKAIDARLAEQARTAPPEVLFEPETELLIRAKIEDGSEVAAAAPGARNAYFGDLHVHTIYSMDGYSFGTLATPDDAYRFARGEAIKNPAGFDMQLSRPLDFYAVTDHAMFLGLVQAAADSTTRFSKHNFSKPFHALNPTVNSGTDVTSSLSRLGVYTQFVPKAVSWLQTGELDREEVLGIVRSAWEDIVNAADQYYEPGSFTTFVGYEYTTASDDVGNLHRNVIFKDSHRLPREPFSRYHSQNPEDLWQWMDELRAKGVESLAIPHNSNASNGQMFKLADWAGDPLDDDYAKQRIRNEPIIELTQIKGTSETHPALSTRDEWAGFEIMPYRIGPSALSDLKGSYARDALLNGLALEHQGVTNPFQFGFIGSTDTHSAASQVEEQNFVSKLGILSASAEQRGSVPWSGLGGRLAYHSTRAAGIDFLTKVNGRVFTSWSGPTFSASGLAAVWAEENNRESLYDAFRRKEVFATSGPRIKLRFFAGYDFDEDMMNDADRVAQAYATGVSMGGQISAADVAGEHASPGFLIMAVADPQSAPLQRLQIVKGWIDSDGKTHEHVVDVACAGGSPVDAETNRCPDNGARVDLSDCSINRETGAGELAVLWRDPEFIHSQRAFYYARVLENPTCRWSTWDAIRAGVPPRANLAKTLQERAWSSPIHYLAE